jgi:hypothetical protein
LTMSSQELDECHRRWIESSEVRPLVEIVDSVPYSASGADRWRFIDKIECSRQLIILEMNRQLSDNCVHESSYSRLISNRSPSDGESKLVTQAKAAHQNGWITDKKIFNGQILRQLCHHNLLDDNSLSRKNSRKHRFIRHFSLTLVEILPLTDSWWVAWEMSMTYRGELGGHARVRLTRSRLREAIRLRILRKMRDELIKCLRSEDRERIFQDSGIAQQDGVRIFMKPYDWLPARTPEGVRVEMQQIVDKAVRDEDLAVGCGWLLSEVFLKIQETSIILKLEKEFTGYVSSFWKTAMTLPEGHPTRIRMIEEHAEFTARATRLDSTDLLYISNKVFPLTAT